MKVFFLLFGGGEAKDFERQQEIDVLLTKARTEKKRKKKKAGNMSCKLRMEELLVSAATSGPSTCQGPCTQKGERGEGLGSPVLPWANPDPCLMSSP